MEGRPPKWSVSFTSEMSRSSDWATLTCDSSFFDAEATLYFTMCKKAHNQLKKWTCVLLFTRRLHFHYEIHRITEVKKERSLAAIRYFVVIKKVLINSRLVKLFQSCIEDLIGKLRKFSLRMKIHFMSRVNFKLWIIINRHVGDVCLVLN